MAVKKDNIPGIKKLLHTLKQIEKFKDTKILKSLELSVHPCTREELIESCQTGKVKIHQLYSLSFDADLLNLPYKKSEYLLGIFLRANKKLEDIDLPYIEGTIYNETLDLKDFSLIFRNHEKDKEVMEYIKEASQKYYMFRLPYTYNWWFNYCGKEGEQRWYLEDNGTEFTMFNCRALEKEEHEKRKHLSITSKELIQKLEDHIKNFTG